MRPIPLMLVGAGGFLGAIARYLIGSVMATRFGSNWPYGTFVINVSGCFAIAFFLTLSAERVVMAEGWRYFFPIGFVGAYTTFSTFEWETMRLVEDGAWVRALFYVLASTVIGFAAVLLATWTARRF